MPATTTTLIAHLATLGMGFWSFRTNAFTDAPNTSNTFGFLVLKMTNAAQSGGCYVIAVQCSTGNSSGKMYTTYLGSSATEVSYWREISGTILS